MIIFIFNIIMKLFIVFITEAKSLKYFVINKGIFKILHKLLCMS